VWTRGSGPAGGGISSWPQGAESVVASSAAGYGEAAGTAGGVEALAGGDCEAVVKARAPARAMGGVVGEVRVVDPGKGGEVEGGARAPAPARAMGGGSGGGGGVKWRWAQGRSSTTSARGWFGGHVSLPATLWFSFLTCSS
jgi:hypothetical protein